jgi:hypothetical protein
MSSEVKQTDLQSASSSAPPQPSASPSSSPASAALLVASTLVSLAAMSWVGLAWVTGMIPDWRYGLGGILVASLPAGVIGDLAKVAIRRFAGSGK